MRKRQGGEERGRKREREKGIERAGIKSIGGRRKIRGGESRSWKKKEKESRDKRYRREKKD